MKPIHPRLRPRSAPVLGILTLLVPTLGAEPPTCPSLPGAGVEAELRAGTESDLRCEYHQEGELPWPIGELRLVWQQEGALSGLSDLCRDPAELLAGTRIADGRAALVRVRPNGLGELPDQAWEQAGQELLAQVASRAQDCAEARSAPAVSPEVLRPSLSQSQQERARALYQQGENAYYGRNGVSKDYARAFAAYQECSLLENADCEYSLAYMLHKGLGTGKDSAQAIHWAEKAASARHGPACYFLGERYFYGQGVARNYSQAAHWYREGAEVDHGASEYSLGYLHETGKGVAKNYAEAMRLYAEAASHGNSTGMFGVGDLYYLGRGVKRDYARALAWFRKGAAKGQGGSLNRLGEMYLQGRGVRKDRKQALEYFKQAARKGNSKAQKRLKQWKVAY